jgi:hypothetical protein
MRRFGAMMLLLCGFFFTALSLHAQATPTSKSAVIHLVAVVPPMLNLSLDFAQNATALVSGYLDEGDFSAAAKGGAFGIREGTKVELGNARLFSNIPGSYSINVYSANGGTLKDASGVSGAAIPYTLSLGDKESPARDGTFSFSHSGVSTRDGAALKVGLAISRLPVDATRGLYVDNLLFAVAAN